MHRHVRKCCEYSCVCVCVRVILAHGNCECAHYMDAIHIFKMMANTQLDKGKLFRLRQKRAKHAISDREHNSEMRMRRYFKIGNCDEQNQPEIRVAHLNFPEKFCNGSNSSSHRITTNHNRRRIYRPRRTLNRKIFMTGAQKMPNAVYKFIYWYVRSQIAWFYDGFFLSLYMRCLLFSTLFMCTQSFVQRVQEK